MAVRNDISVDWTQSPRIVTVGAPSTEITVQDLLDTLRTLEAAPANIDEPQIVDASGKENLGGGTKVGLTVKLLNAKLAFEARPGPSWVLCSISGGNLVAVDVNSNDIDVRQPTAYTSVDRVSSSSATLQEQSALQYASFGGAVSVDVANQSGRAISGTEYPAGSQEHPSDNLVDALAIANGRGFNSFQVLGDLEVDSQGDYEGMSFVGESMNKSTLLINSDANVYRAEFYDCLLTGVLDGEAMARNCRIQQLQYINGIVEQCLLGGQSDGDPESVITLGGGARATFLDCWSGAVPTSLPVIDFAGTGQELIVRNYSGGLRLRNKTGPDQVSITLAAGTITLENTVTAGTIKVSGAGAVVDENDHLLRSGVWNGNVIIDVDELISSAVGQQTEYGGRVTVDPINGIAGTDYPVGTMRVPVNNFADAIVIANARGLNTLAGTGAAVLDVGLSNLTILGTGAVLNNSLDLNNQVIDGVVFINCKLSGQLNAVRVPGEGWATTEASVEFKNCYLDDIVDLEGTAKNCQIEGATPIKAGGWFSSMDTVIEGDFTVFNMGGEACAVSMDITSGYAQFVNAVAGCLIELNVKGGEVELYDSCTGGEFYVEGFGKLYNSSAMTVKDDNLLDSTVDLIKVKTDALPGSIGRARALDHFHVFMVSSVDHRTPATGLTPTVSLAKDDGEFDAFGGTIVEVGYGVYDLQGTTALDTDCVSGTFRIEATGADTRYLSFVTSP